MAARELGRHLGNPLGKRAKATTTTIIEAPDTSWNEFVVGTVASGSPVTDVKVSRVDESVVFISHNDGASTAGVKVVSLSGKVASFGSALTTQSNVQAQNCCALNTGQAIQACCDATTDFMRAHLINISTMSSPGYATVETSYASLPFGLTALSASKALAVYRYNSGGYLSGRVLTVSGDTINVGARCTLNNNANTWQSAVVALSDTKAIAVYRDNSTGFMNAIVLTISGDTITAGTPVPLSVNAVNTQPELQAISSTQAIFCSPYDGGGSVRAHVIDIADTTPTWGTALSISASVGDDAVAVEVMSDNTVTLAFPDITSTYPIIYKLSLSGSTLTSVGSKIISTTGSSDGFGIGRLADNLAMMTCTQTQLKAYPLKLV